MADRRRDVVAWARKVRHGEPHGLRALEDVLLDNGAGTSTGRVPERYLDRVRKAARDRYGILGCTLIGAPGWGVVAFVTSPPMYPDYKPINIDAAFWSTAVAACMGLGFLALVAVAWLRNNRRRDEVVIYLAACYVILGLLTLNGVARRSEEFSGDTTPYLVPVWALIVASLLTVGYQLAGSRGSRIVVSELTEEAHARLLEKRAAALRVLADRGMLAGQNVEVLSARPLGRLDRPQEGHVEG